MTVFSYASTLLMTTALVWQSHNIEECQAHDSPWDYLTPYLQQQIIPFCLIFPQYLLGTKRQNSYIYSDKVMLCIPWSHCVRNGALNVCVAISDNSCWTSKPYRVGFTGTGHSDLYGRVDTPIRAGPICGWIERGRLDMLVANQAYAG